MAQGGQSISGNAIKWRETNVNVPFSPLGGNFEMFLEYFRPHRHSITAIHAGRDEGCQREKRQTRTWTSSNLSAFTMQDTFISPSQLHGKKITFCPRNLSSLVRAVKDLIKT